MGRPRKDGTPASTLGASELKQARNIVSQMHAELQEPVDDYFGTSYARKCGYLEVKIEALMVLLRMV